jgi:hypothetical protein
MWAWAIFGDVRHASRFCVACFAFCLSPLDVMFIRLPILAPLGNTNLGRFEAETRNPIRKYPVCISMLNSQDAKQALIKSYKSKLVLCNSYNIKDIKNQRTGN